MANLRRIALLLPKGHEYAARLIEGVIGFVQDDAEFDFVEVPYDEGRTPPAVYQLEVDGALVWAHHSSRWVLDLRDRGIKVVSLNGEWITEGIPCVGFDYDAITDAAIEHLSRLRRRHAAYVGHLSSQNPSKLRLRDGFLAGANKRGWTAEAFEISGIPSEQRERLAKPEAEIELSHFLCSLKKPVAIHCDDDYVGVLVCRVAEHLGLRVPDDVAVLGFFDMTIARFNKPTLSSIPAPGDLVGAMGMQVLSDVLKGKALSAMRVSIPSPPAVQRESTGGMVLRNDDIRRAYDLIQEHACQGLTVEQLLKRISLTQKTLNKRFISVYGQTPGEAIRHVRTERAKQLLSKTDLSIARIAMMCGFGEPSNFNLFFRREVGCTPSEYRRQSGPASREV